MSMSEITMTTEYLLGFIAQSKHTQKGVVLVYGEALKADVVGTREGIGTRGFIDWPAVNKAIIERWSLTGLKRVKELAWKVVETA